VNAGNITVNYSVHDVAGNVNSTQFNFTLPDATPPEYQAVINNPAGARGLDPDTRVDITANISEFSNISTALLKWKRYNDSNIGTKDFNSKRMDRQGDKDFTHTYKSNFTPTEAGNYTYYIFANDTLGQAKNSTRTNLTVEFDRNWTLTINLTDQTDTFDRNVSIGNLTINNTADFNRNFKFDAGTFNTRIWINSSQTPTSFEIEKGSTATFKVNATTRSEGNSEGTDNMTLTIENQSSNPTSRDRYFLLTTSAGGPFLDISWDKFNSSIRQGQEMNISAKVTNRGNETAINTSLEFKLPNGWDIVKGSQKSSSEDVAVGTSLTHEARVKVTTHASTGNVDMKAIALS
ncbi:MAG: NEW3 domain-containing protein, partial [Candidatus Nanohaloarchaea archaeon]|nr:NEW3 domain-containing protein [Candidatus Nanohaloarchaea archaeon]